MQTNYNPIMAPALVGQIADLSIKVIDSFAAEAPLYPANVVMRGTDPGKQVKPVAAEGDCAKAIGIVVHEHKEQEDPYFPIGYCVNVMTKGRIWVMCDGAVDAGAKAKFDAVNGVFSASNGVELGIPCVFVTGTKAAGLAEVQIG